MRCFNGDMLLAWYVDFEDMFFSNKNPNVRKKIFGNLAHLSTSAGNMLP